MTITSRMKWEPIQVTFMKDSLAIIVNYKSPDVEVDCLLLNCPAARTRQPRQNNLFCEKELLSFARVKKREKY